MSPKRSGFTLIELLVVIVIIAILVGLLFPAINWAVQRARMTKVRSEVTGLETALQSYYREYGIWPSSLSDNPVGVLVDTAVRDTLRGTDATTNPKKLPFMEFPDGDFKDPWNNEYRCSVDDDYNGTLSTPSDASLNREVAVWSMGPDGAAPSDDDICSWKK